jgi:hypothetical protein
MPRIDDAALALGRDDVVPDLRNDIAEAGLWVDGDRLAPGVLIDAAVGRAAKAGDLREFPTRQPARKIELLAMLAIGMDAHVLSIRRPQKMHGVSDHHGTFVEVVLMAAVGLADAVRRRLQRGDEILEVQPILPHSDIGVPIAHRH